MINDSTSQIAIDDEIAAVFQASPPAVKVGAWLPVASIDDNVRFERRVEFKGSGGITIAVAISTNGGNGQRSLYREIRDARDSGRLPPATATAFGLQMLDGGANVFRKYLIAKGDASLFCTYEGIGAPEPFVRCSWSKGHAAYSIETAPVAVHHALSSRTEIEHLSASSGEF